MFDVGFSELLVIGVVALIVLGPERLPKVARTAGHLFGRFQRYVSEVKAEIRREMHNEEIMKLQTSLKEAKETLTGVEQSIRQEMGETGALLKAVPEEVGSLEFVEEPKPVEVSRTVPAEGENASPPGPSPQLELPLPSRDGEVPPPAARS
ncbi:MAG: Sec-independent protein translocase protein TatB [Burkholderiales bacterium]|jgi:sec-independent protein translocase protein TatB|nr:Sec-independent protein translocase protein TatB [Burkholderiales bacterium]